MAWKVEVKTSAAKEIAQFDRTVQRRIYTFLKQLEGERNPRELLLPYTGALTGHWKKAYRRFSSHFQYRRPAGNSLLDQSWTSQQGLRLAAGSRGDSAFGDGGRSAQGNSVYK